LIRLFKTEKKITFYQFVLQQRVSESKRMLLNCPDTTLTDIAYAVGFPSAAQFSRVFRASTGMLPSQFRNRMTKS
jgi:AraC-like DNA-binding protein